MIGFWKTTNNTYLYFIYKIDGDNIDALQIYVPKQPNPKIDIIKNSSRKLSL